MDASQDLKTLERQAYLETYSDGTIDLFVGLSLTWIGAAWIWLPDLAGIAGDCALLSRSQAARR